MARLSCNSKNRENLMFNDNKISFLLKLVCETINNKNVYRNKFKNKRYTLQRYRRSSSYKEVMYIQKLHPFVIHPPLMMAQSRAENTKEKNNYGRYINQFPPNIIKSIRQYERINKKYVDQNVYYVQRNMY